MGEIGCPEYGVFAVDPGGSTGLAWGRLKDAGTVAERLAAMEGAGSATVKDRDWMAQACAIVKQFELFRLDCRERGLPAYMVCEDFILRGLNSDRVALYPVWVGAAIVAYRQGLASVLGGGPVEVTWQQPGQAKGYATDERLKRWGLWVKGRDHERDACRHLAYFVANAASQRMRLARSR